ncbi:thiol reductant ABC exporter subunit CydC [Catellatospora methionotrophica]|uniref:Thiol reductant ABC exporter subunit CydC n=1 Tax=Catellatospora methionotrophica TaxID=121620 RepID=A0A8J3PI54_9ACTN|nr:thiol reductant ABC exporter subunit CydC [Catellatospora methionotrophica]GIG16046.1 thiol reductant ABC exporter subunit CydC [Catellatospora methionotrophica]
MKGWRDGVMGRVLVFAYPLRWRFVGAGLLAAGTEAAGLGLMAAATWLLATAAGQPPLIALSVAIVLVRALAIGRGVLRYVERLASHDAVLRMVTEVRARIFAALVDRPPARRADALSRMVSDVDAVQDLVIRVLLPMAAAGLVAVAAVGTALFADPAVAGVLLAGLLITGVALPLLAARLARHGSARLAPLRAAYAVDTVDLVHGAADLAAFGARPAYEARGRAHADELARVERALARRSFAVDAAATALGGVTAMAVLATALSRGLPGVWLAVLAVATIAAGELALSLLAAARKGAEIQGSLHRVAELLDVPETAVADGLPVPDGSVHLRLRGAGVRYRTDAAPALHDVDLDLPPGRRIAVVGPSGAGKSTLLALLTGAISPDSGSATSLPVATAPSRVGVTAPPGAGTPITAFDRERWPAAVTGLLADAHLFHASVRDNLLLARPGATDEDLLAACRTAGLGDWVDAHGLDVRVGEDGAELSGGQRQRLALARAVLADPQVLLLDEPTEGLDPAQADAVLADVLAHRAGRSVVLVTHRLTGLDAFDEVVVLDGGRVKERGTQGWVRAHGG